MSERKSLPDRTETLANVRAMYPAYAKMPDMELGNALAAKYPDAYGFLKVEVPRGEGDKVTGPTTPEGIAGSVLNPGQPEKPNMVQSIGNAVLPPLVTAPAIAAGGEVAGGLSAIKAAPAVGRAITSGLVGGAKAASEGKGAGGIAWDAVVDTLVGGASEGAASLATHLKVPFTGMRSLAEAGEKVPGAKKGFEGAGKALEKARDLIASRLPKTASLNVPALSNSPMTLQEAVKSLQGLKGEQYQIARQQLVHALNENDKQMIARGVKPLTKPFSGQIFGKFSPKERFQYRGTAGERAATNVLEFSRSPAARAALESEATPEVAPDIPRAMVPVLGAKETFGKLAEHAKPKL